jgi:arylsulfatase A-like enzyme
MKDKIRPYIPAPGFLTYTLLLIQLCYYIIYVLKQLPGFSFSAPDLISILFSFFTLYLFGVVCESLMPVKLIARILSPLIIFTACGLYSYHLSTGFSLDFALVKDNIGISFSAEALQMMSAPFSGSDFLFIAALLTLTVILEFRYSLFSGTVKPGLKSGATAFVLAAIIILLPVQRGDEFTLFMKSAFTPNEAAAAVSDTGGYPYERDKINLKFAGSGRQGQPNIILILIESFNANFVEAKAPDGIAYTPNFNSLISKGLYIDRFYGNSIQTCKGQAAVFYSILPGINGKIFVDYPDLNITGFPSLLRDSGYHTIFFQAFHNLKFDNTTHNMHKAGFSVVKSYAEFRKKEDRPYIWGWGVEDKIFYERAFELLDAEHAKNPGKPLFASLMTVGTHIPCDGMPVESRTIYKDPKNIKEKYSNALRLSDSQLPGFFELLKQRKYLENTIVIITADHSFPMKEHGLYNNEICFYDEAFRIPFLVIWDGVIKPERVNNTAYSQIDIGPTIADLARIKKGRHNMTGITVFDRKKDNTVYLVQPYNGKFLQVVRYPLKFITHIKTGKEYLFNLEDDPKERFNLMETGSGINEASKLRESVNAIFLNQKLIEENRIRRP